MCCTCLDLVLSDSNTKCLYVTSTEPVWNNRHIDIVVRMQNAFVLLLSLVLPFGCCTCFNVVVVVDVVAAVFVVVTILAG